MFSNTEGSWLQEAQAADERKLGEWEQLYEKALRAKRIRPRLAGYDKLISEIRGLRNDWRAEKGMPFLDGPEGPWDLIKERKKALSNQRLDELGL